jgi:hypothetical protein
MYRKRFKIKKSTRVRWPLLLTSVIWFGVLAFIIRYVEPYVIADVGIRGIYLPWWIIWFLAIFFLLAGLGTAYKRSLWWSIGIIGFGILRLLGLGNPLNAGLIITLLCVLEYYVRIDDQQGSLPEDADASSNDTKSTS